MVDLNNLKIETMAFEAELALNYFKLHNNSFHSLTPFNMSTIDLEKSDGYNKISCVPEKHIQNMNIKYTESSLQSIQLQLNTLVKEIENNAELFSQIEFLIRKKPISELKGYDIKLILQNLKYNSTANTINTCAHYDELSDISSMMNTIIMNTDTPMACLGYVAQVYKMCRLCYIRPTPETAVISYLFTKLCHLSGMDAVYLIFTTENPSSNPLYHIGLEKMKGCLGVVTGQADVDSAVDAFLDTTTKYPWRLSRILIQESVYLSFKKALQWKTRNSSGEAETPSLARQCSAFYTYKDKKFLLEYGGINPEDGITVEAYRTTKELLSLVSEDESFMSLWTNDLSEANEIVHQQHSPNVIWVNDYGIFDGPPVSSQALYEINVNQSAKLIANVPVVTQKLKSKQVQWLNLSFEDRYNTIYFIILNFVIENQITENDKVWSWLRSLKGWNSADSVHIHNNNMCICKTTAAPTPVHVYGAPKYTEIWSEIAKLLVIGTEIEIQKDKENSIYSDLFTRLENAGAPIIQCSIATEKAAMLTTTKAIWSNHGTIFAN